MLTSFDPDLIGVDKSENVQNLQHIGANPEHVPVYQCGPEGGRTPNLLVANEAL